ncbi:hypothetical protein [Collimonas humicola]|uniref:hypothetical protein n=1 Tax=Collimonas humicola TaxID=2825886 RepID=UPI001B8CB596|nr:hypothetical protein [Collimonas humicola]
MTTMHHQTHQAPIQHQVIGKTIFSNRDLPETLLLCFGFALALLIPVVVGAGSLSPLRMAAVCLISVASVFFGRALGLILQLPRKSGFAAAFEIVVGFSALSLLHLSVTAIMNLSTGVAVLADAMILLVFCGMVERRVTPQKSSCAGQFQRSAHAFRSTMIDVAVLLMISIFVTVWAREALASVRSAEVTGVFRVWSDFLLQAAEIKYLEDYPSFAKHSIYLADTHQALYHRASYALSAIYSWMTKDPELETSTYFWMPTGLILLGLGAYGLGTALAGRIAGCIAVMALFMLPDASMYWFKNGYFAFHWLIQVAPGAGYALALVLIALGVYVLGVASSRFQLMLVAAFLTLISAAFRVHIAIPAIMLFACLLLQCWQPVKSWHRSAAILAMLLIGIAAMVFMESVTFAPHLLTGQRDGLLYIEAVHAATPTAYEGFYAKATAGAGDIWKGILGYALILPAQYGAILPALLVLIFLRIRSSTAIWAVDIIPFLLLAVHCAITFLLPTPSNGDITEWSHRSFVLLYAVLLIFMVTWMWPMASDAYLRGRKFWRLQVVGALVISCVGMIVPWQYGKRVQEGSLRDGPSACATVISGDMFKMSRYVREHAHSGDRMLMSNGDPIALGVALTGLQAYVSREQLFQKVGGDVAKVAASRSAENRRLSDITNFEGLSAFGRKAGVRWYILQPGDMPGWSRELLDRAVFVSGNLRVFDLQS